MLCAICRKDLPGEAFQPSYRGRPGSSFSCRSCKRAWRSDPDRKEKEKARQRERYATDPAYREMMRASREKFRATAKAKTWQEAYLARKDPRYFLVVCAKHRAKLKGIPFDLAPEDFEIPEFCPLLGIRLKREKGKLCPASPSLDRIRPELGYVRDNVWVISHRANFLKGDATHDELRLLAANLERRLSAA